MKRALLIVRAMVLSGKRTGDLSLVWRARRIARRLGYGLMAAGVDL